MAIKNPKSACEECPRFDFCEINKCPLHVDYLSLFNDPSDPAMRTKQKCIAKSIRKRIGVKWNLPNIGLTPREQTSQSNWDNLSEESKSLKIAKLKKNSPVSRLLASGHTIIPPRANHLQNPHTNNQNTPKSSTNNTLSSSNPCSQVANPGFPNQNEFEGVGEL